MHPRGAPAVSGPVQRHAGIMRSRFSLALYNSGLSGSSVVSGELHGDEASDCSEAWEERGMGDERRPLLGSGSPKLRYGSQQAEEACR